MESNLNDSDMDPNQTSSSSGDQSTHMEVASRSLSLSLNRLPMRQLQSTTSIDAEQMTSRHRSNRDGGDWEDRYNEHLRSIGDFGAAPASRPSIRQAVDDHTTAEEIPTTRSSTAQAADEAPGAEDATANAFPALQPGVDNLPISAEAAAATPSQPNPLTTNTPQAHQIQVKQGPEIQTPANAPSSNQIPAPGYQIRVHRLPANQIPANWTIIDHLKEKFLDIWDCCCRC